MIYDVKVTYRARNDLDRPVAWLAERNSRAAADAAQRLRSSLASLTEMPLRGRKVSALMREIVVPFGAAAYLIRYSVQEDTVYIARILHSLEQR